MDGAPSAALAAAAALLVVAAVVPAAPAMGDFVEEWSEEDACWRYAAGALAEHQREEAESEVQDLAPSVSTDADLESPARTWLHRGADVGGWDAAPPHEAPANLTLAEAVVSLYDALGLAGAPASEAAAEDFAGALSPELRAELAPVVWRLGHAVDHRRAALEGAGFDQAELVHAADGLLRAVSDQAPVLRDLPEAAWPSEPVRDPAGLVAVGSYGNDTYTEHRFLQVDPGGDDVFLNNAGGGAVFVDFNPSKIRYQEVALHLDLDGDDRYGADGDRLSYAQGAAFQGIGVMVDWAGDDEYFGHRSTQGASRDAGVGVAWERAGNDSYDATFRGQGASHGGLGMLLDEDGDDRHVLGFEGLGYATLSRAVGVLADSSGEDVYDGNSDDMVGYGEWDGKGIFLDDGEGTDAYTFSGNTWAGDDETWRHEDVGIGCDDR